MGDVGGQGTHAVVLAWVTKLRLRLSLGRESAKYASRRSSFSSTGEPWGPLSALRATNGNSSYFHKPEGVDQYPHINTHDFGV